MQKIILIFIALLSFFLSFGQYERTQIEVFNSEIVVNSRTSIDGYTRNFVSIDLPDNSYGYIYRLTIKERGQTVEQAYLIKAIKSIPDKRIQMGVEIAELVLPLVNPILNGKRIDLYVMNNFSDVTNFYKRERFNSCTSLNGIGNICYASSACVGKRIFFGLKNNNFTQGLTVRLEVAALVIVNPNKVNGSNTSASEQILKTLFPDNSNSNSKKQETATTIIENWNTQEGKENTEIMQKYLDNFIVRDSMKLRSSASISDLKSCVISKVKKTIDYSEYVNNTGTGRRDALSPLYRECATGFYFDKYDDDYIVAKNFGANGWAYWEQGEYDLALDYYNKSLVAKPLAFVKLNIGLYYLVKGMTNEAKKNYEEAISIIRSSQEPIGYKRGDLRGGIKDIIRENVTTRLAGSNEIIEMLQKKLMRYEKN